MTQHTPGPWDATGSSVFAGSLPIAHTFLNPGIDVDHANARLIAAAPDLLAIAKMVQQGMAVGMCLETWAELRDKLDDVLAKATGKES